MKKLLYKGSVPYTKLSEEEKELIKEIKELIRVHRIYLRSYKNMLKLNTKQLALLKIDRNNIQAKKDYFSNRLSDLVQWVTALMRQEKYLQRKAYPYHNREIYKRIISVQDKIFYKDNYLVQELEQKQKELENNIKILSKRIKELKENK